VKYTCNYSKKKCLKVIISFSYIKLSTQLFSPSTLMLFVDLNLLYHSINSLFYLDY